LIGFISVRSKTTVTLNSSIYCKQFHQYYCALEPDFCYIFLLTLVNKSKQVAYTTNSFTSYLCCTTVWITYILRRSRQISLGELIVWVISLTRLIFLRACIQPYMSVEKTSGRIFLLSILFARTIILMPLTTIIVVSE